MTEDKQIEKAEDVVMLTREEFVEVYRKLYEYQRTLEDLQTPLHLDLEWLKKYIVPVRQLLGRLKDRL